jgi:peptidoglycan/LPS O-acetylase OafA/YrhL
VWHYGVFAAAERHGPSWPAPVRLLASWAASLLIAYASHRFLERPFLRRRSRSTAPVPESP